MNRLSGPVPWTQRLVAILVWVVGLAIAAGVLVFGFFVGAALLGVAAIVGLIAWARLRWGKPVIPRRAPSAAPRTGETIIDAEYVVIRREQR
ncbi:MAG: hypothetical protein JNL89_13095 [Rhodanobacteraceae bacterium]|nr:hypothetical protein [Rhodanobacteraceae bacterium]